jgi:cell division protein FtsN
LALAPSGLEPESAVSQALAVAVDRGAPLIGVVQEGWSQPETRIAATPAPRRRGRRRSVAAAVLALAASGWLWHARSTEPPEAGPAAAHAAQRPSPPPPPPPVDTMPWTVQLAAYGTPEGAVVHADALAADGVPALVAPVAPTASSTIWYRVLAGHYRERDSALAGRAVLWKRGAARAGEGDLLHAPYSLVVDAALAPDTLRRLGIPAVRWADGRLLVGAFESPEQAAFAQAALERAGVPATLVTRTEPSP